MATNTKIGHGSTFELRNSAVSPPVFVTVGEVTSIMLPALARDAVDVTHTESTDRWREFIPGLKDAGEVTVEMNFISGSASDALIRAQFDSDELSQARISTPESPPTDVITFSCIVTGYEVEAPLDDKMVATLTLKVSGAKSPTREHDHGESTPRRGRLRPRRQDVQALVLHERALRTGGCA